MSKILHCFLCLIFLGYTGVAMAVTGTIVTPGGGTVVTPGGGTVVGPSATTSGSYSCPTYRKYSSCKAGYYLAYSYSGTSGNNLRHYPTPRAGNACRPCSDYDAYKKVAKGSHTCAGGTAAPVLNTVTITYNLNGGSGTTPDSESCTRGQTCTLNDGATTTFYRAGYVFKGWAVTSTATSGFTSNIFNANDTVYAVWEKCGLGEYKPGSGTQAAAACSSCPELTPGFEYWRVDGLLPSSVNTCFQAVIDPGDVDSQCTSTDTSIPAIVQVAASDDAWGTMTAAAVLAAKPGAYLNFQTSQVIPEGTDLDDICTECGVGTYSEGGTATSCSACPELTPGFEYLPTTGNTSLTACRQGIAKAADVNEYCATSSETTEQFDIQCEATPDGTWYDCIIGNAWTAKPGSYVGIWKQEMPAEDVIENMCIQCTDGTYSEGGLINSCSSCPELNPMDEQAGWRVSSGGDGATSWNACYAYWERFPSNCASGSFKKIAVSSLIYGTEWFELEPLTAKPGYMVQFEDGQTTAPACVACTDATFSPGGDVHSCSACPPGYDANTETGKTSAAECQISCDAGTYVATANAACTTVGSGYYKAAHMVNYGSTSTRDQCPSGYQNSAAGADVINDCYMNVSGGKYVETENATTTATCAAGTYKAAHTVYYGSTSSCSACTGRTKYSGAGASACSTVDSGYYSTGCNTSGNNCTGQSQCTGATYCSGGVQYNCPAQSSGWTRNGGNGWTSYTQCNQTRAATEAWSYCSAGTLKQNATSATAWGAPTVSEALSAKAGAYVNGTTCSQCTAGDYCTGGTAARKDCPSGYPNSAAGSDAITDCYSNTKSRPWSGSQVNGAVPTNCSAVTEWGICSRASCDYVAYSNSTGTADGTIKSGCETNNDSCTKPVQAVSAKPGFYDAGTTCTECPSGYPNSDASNEGGITQCYSDEKSRPWMGGQISCETPAGCSDSTCNICTLPACSYVAYSNSTGSADGAIKSGCATNNEDCQQTVKSVTANAGRYVSGITCPACAVGTFQGADDSTATSCTVCAANTYAASTGMSACTACPSGYSTSGDTAANHDAKSDCSITCAAGTRVVTPDAACTTPTGSWYTASHSVTAGSTTPTTTVKACLTNYSTPNTTTRTDHDASTDCKISCAAGTRIVTANATSCTTPAGNWYVGAHSVAQGSVSSYSNCLTNYTISGTAAANHDTASDCKISCGGGSYIANANNTTCSDVGAGYWAAASTVSQGSPGVRNACDDGLTTIGSGAGADEAGDCGRVLNVNGEKIYLRSTKKTTPSLNVGINGKTFYGNMGTATKGTLRINSGGTTYSVYDDSM